MLVPVPASLNLRDQSRIYACGVCGATVNTSLRECPACRVRLDPTQVGAAADLMARISGACADARSIKITAEFFAIGLFAAKGLLHWGPTPLPSGDRPWDMLSLAWKAIGLASLIVPVMVMRWYVRFQSLRSPDPDLPKARRDVRIGLGIFVVIALAAILLDPILEGIRSWISGQ
jgi:hypothetical protein